MELQTKIPLQPERDQIDYGSKVLLMGSCFVEHIGEKLGYYQFLNLQNPFGIVFHPIAIEKLITRAINEDYYTEKDVMFINEQWFCFETHSSVSNSNKEDFLVTLNSRLKQLQEYILNATHIVFTYGTAWVYRFLETDSVVANCHKIPQKKFLKELLSVEEIKASIENTYTLIRSVNPKSILIHTVSPVRHLKDGFIENTRSKAHLITSIHELVNPKIGLYYFPSYEIMMDELRDYRFYTEDMLHPNSTATSIIWERFNTTWISSATTELQKEIETVQLGLQHKPFHPASGAHQGFKKNLQEKIEKLQLKIPHLKL
jgi:lysophospholipase L1-like esterase